MSVAARRPIVGGIGVIAVCLATATVAVGHGVGDPRLDKEQYKSQASLLTATYTKDDDFAVEIGAEKSECQQFTSSIPQARQAWTQTMRSQADSLVASREDWDTHKTWALELAPSAFLYKKASLVRTASRKLAVGIGYEQDADTQMRNESDSYASFSCGDSAPLDAARSSLSKGKGDIKEGLAALKTAVDAEG